MQIHARSADSVTPTPTPPVRVALRLWGYEPAVVERWTKALPDAGGRLSWEVAVDRDANGADVVIHLVNPSRGVAPFCWNCAGANHAMRLSSGAGRTEIALLAGHFHQVDMPRAGHWVASKGLPMKTALYKLAESMANPVVDQEQWILQ
ncbi:hypothetical protein [Paraburkholderia sp. RL17-337-BIB-A]|uniref:hypothetical protein n=1 Tax=Paraburkholderia sp. RL17-337-BIB-A TaxID=3031636 RepID=UPI0038BB7352